MKSLLRELFFFLEKPLFEGRNQLSTRETVSIKGRFELDVPGRCEAILGKLL